MCHLPKFHCPCRTLVFRAIALLFKRVSHLSAFPHDRVSHFFLPSYFLPARPPLRAASFRVRQLRSLEEALLAFSSSITLRRTDGRTEARTEGRTDGRTEGAPLSLPLSLSSLLFSRESVGLFRLMNLGVSGESGLASKQIRGKISARRRRKDEKEGKKEGRRTERLTDCHLEKIYGRTIAAQKPFRPRPAAAPLPSRERGKEGGRDSEGGREALTDSVPDKFLRKVTRRLSLDFDRRPPPRTILDHEF